jgi:hypothetical protein
MAKGGTVGAHAFLKLHECRKARAPTCLVSPQAEAMLPFLDAHMAQLSALAAGAYFSPRSINMLFQYASHAIAVPACYKRVGGAGWDALLANVAFPLMAFNEEDAELWRDDPQEYIRKASRTAQGQGRAGQLGQWPLARAAPSARPRCSPAGPPQGYDILEDMYSPKTAASNFAHDLCRKKRNHLDAFMARVAGLLAGAVKGLAAGAGEGGLSVQEARRVDGALLAVGCLAPQLKHKVGQGSAGAVLLWRRGAAGGWYAPVCCVADGAQRGTRPAAHPWGSKTALERQLAQLSAQLSLPSREWAAKGRPQPQRVRAAHSAGSAEPR